MADEKKSMESTPTLTQNTLEIVAVASQAQASKVRAILERMDAISQLDASKVNNITQMLDAAKADGGCGIGCW